MNKYPMARWSVSPGSVGASVWTRKLAEGEGGGYYLYRWGRNTNTIVVEELVQGTTKDERQWPVNKRSMYVQVGVISAPDGVHELDQRGQEIEVARIVFADMQDRFGEIAEWITYDTFGNPVWFHTEVVGS